MTPVFDIEALRAVVAGIDLRSFARAATQLGRSQSAISMQLKKLERQAGTPLFVRRGRGLVPTEAGEALAAYARRIVALNDEAALALGAAATSATVRLGLPQDFFDDVMPATLAAYARDYPDVHVEVRAGPNHALAEDVRAGRLDGAVAFFPAPGPGSGTGSAARPGPEAGSGAGTRGELLCELPVHWLAHRDFPGMPMDGRVPLVLFDHPCLFRQSALAALEWANRRWRAAVTTPSLPGIWGALRSHLGVAVRTEHGKPADIVRAPKSLGLPALPAIELRMLRTPNAPPAAHDLCEALRRETMERVG